MWLTRLLLSHAGESSQLMRLNKLVVAASSRYNKNGCSRREADHFITKGWVRVNGQVETTLGIKVDDRANIELSSIAQRKMADASANTVVYHKPLGIVSCQPETPDQVPAIQMLTKDNYFNPKARNSKNNAKPNRIVEPYKLPKMATCGRLDVNSTGLLLLTQSGSLVRDIIGPDSCIEKEYLVRVKGPVPLVLNNGDDDDEEMESPKEALDILQRLNEGVKCEETGDLLQAKSVQIQNEHQLNFTLTSGKNHHIRRMCETVGLKVQALKRVRIGGIILGDLPVGNWRYLKPHEKVDRKAPKRKNGTRRDFHKKQYGEKKRDSQPRNGKQ